MQGFEILIPITGIIIGGLIFLIPITGLTARFALKPVMEAIARMKTTSTATEHTALLEQRLALVEEQLHALERGQERLEEAVDFQRQLEAPRG